MWRDDRGRESDLTCPDILTKHAGRTNHGPDGDNGANQKEDDVKLIPMTAAVALLCAGAAQAVEESDYLLESAQDLADLCGAPGDMSAIHMCHGFLVGVGQMHQGIVEAVGASIYCVPDDTDVTRDSFSAEFAQWIAANPEKGELVARRGLLEFATVRFPCQ